MRHLIPRQAWWYAGMVLLVLASGEWLGGPGLGPALVATLGALAGVVAARGRHDPWVARLAMWLGVAVTVGLGLAEFRRMRLQRSWPAQHALLTQRAADDALRRLEALRTDLEELARAGGMIATRVPERAFAQAERLASSRGPELGLAILDAQGRLTTWAGTHRLKVGPGGESLALHRSAFYAVLEVRRQRSDGGTVVATGLIAAGRELRDPPASVAGAVHRTLGATLELGDPAAPVPDALLWPRDLPLVAFSVTPPSREEATSSLLMRSGRVIGWLLLGLTVALVLSVRARAPRYAVLALVPFLFVRVPLGDHLGLAGLFTPASYFSPALGPLSGSAGLLVVTGCLVLVLTVGLWHAGLGRNLLTVPLGITAAVAAPYIIRELGRGITPPAGGVPMGLWLTWHTALLLFTASLLVVAAALLRGRGDLPRRGLAVWLGVGAGIVAGIVGVFVFTGRPGWPAWYTAFWVPAVLLVTRPGPPWVVVTGIALVAGSGASLMTWGAAMAGRTDVALRDIARLGREPDALAEPLLLELAATAAERAPSGPGDLYRIWHASSLRDQGYPIRMRLSAGDSVVADLTLDDLGVPEAFLDSLEALVEPWHRPTVHRVAVPPGVIHVLVAPLPGGSVLAGVTGPRSSLVSPASLGRILETGPERTSLYRLTLSRPPSGSLDPAPPGWRREGWALRATRPIAIDTTDWDVNAMIPLGNPGSIFVRGGLVVLMDVVLLALLWLFAERMAGVSRTLPRLRGRPGSYQARLAVALSVFFVTPAGVLAAFGMRQLAGEARQSRDLVLERVLRDAVPLGGFDGRLASAVPETGLLPRRVDADLALYVAGRRVAVTDPLLAELAAFPAILDPRAHHAIGIDGDRYAGQSSSDREVRAGYLSAGIRGLADGGVLATLAPSPDRAVRDRQGDVALSLLLVTLLGVIAAVGAARGAARALSRPVSQLRSAALQFGREGSVPAPPSDTPREFAPVFDAFTRMATDVRASQAALEAARRRTEAVLATVSTGVVALDREGRVLAANARAEAAVGAPLRPGSLFVTGVPVPWRAVALDEGRGAPGLEVDADGRRYEVQVAPLPAEVGGLVLAINDVTEAARAARVLAWADVANQVAHAIKNPLTPLRLGIQHLQRVRDQRPARFDETLTETTSRILTEIDRLDAIARAFSRLAAPAEAGRPIEDVECAAVCREVAALYHMAPDVALRIAVDEGLTVPARHDELTEVLLNLCDNARNAGASEITIRMRDGVLEVADNGRGIDPDHLPRIFEPRFSTTSSGSGLGLAIVRRLVESWGASVEARSAETPGATFAIRFPVDGRPPVTTDNSTA